MAEKKNSVEGFNMLEIELYRYGTLVFGRVIAQSELIRAFSSERLDHYSKNGYSIVSDCGPEIENKMTLCIRGADKRDDNSKFYYNFDSVNDASKFCSAIQRGVDVINGKVVDDEVPGVVSGLEKVI